MTTRQLAEYLGIAGLVAALFQEYRIALYCWLAAMVLGTAVNWQAARGDWRKARQEFGAATLTLLVATLAVGIAAGALAALVLMDMQGGW